MCGGDEIFTDIYPENTKQVWDYLADFIPHQLSDYVDYYGFITNTFDEIEIEETKDNYIFLSETDFEELYLQLEIHLQRN